MSTSSHQPEVKPRYPGYEHCHRAQPESPQQQSGDGAVLVRSVFIASLNEIKNKIARNMNTWTNNVMWCEIPKVT